MRSIDRSDLCFRKFSRNVLLKECRMNNRDKAVIFVHIPKAAGATLAMAIRKQYKNSLIYSIDGLFPQWSVDNFVRLSMKRRQKIRYIEGHIGFGLHKYLPQGAVYVSMVRDPVKRLISGYNYILETPKSPFHAKMVKEKMTFEDYVQWQISENSNNGQTRFIAGMVPLDSVMAPFPPLPKEALDVAMHNIEEHFRVCGLTERFDESLLLMKEIFGWKNVFYRRKNITKNKKQSEVLSKSMLLRLKESESLDFDLFNYVQKRLVDMINRYSITKEKVDSFRQKNTIYSSTWGRWDVLRNLERSSLRKAGICFNILIRNQKCK